MPFAAMWMDLEIIAPSEASHKEEDTVHVTSPVRASNKTIQMTIERDKSGDWEEQTHTTVHEITKQRAATV